MKKILSMALGFDWFKNFVGMKMARAGGLALVAVAAKSKLAGVILGAFGLSADVITGGAVTLGIMALEYIRLWAKGQTANPPAITPTAPPPTPLQ